MSVEVQTLSQMDVVCAARSTAAHIHRSVPNLEGGNPVKIFGVPRGGVAAAYLVGAELQKIGIVNIVYVEDPNDADFIVDDVRDSGATQARYAAMQSWDIPFFTLFVREDGMPWMSFPWERVDGTAPAEDIATRLLEFVGEDPHREGLQDTPKRFIDAWAHACQGYNQKPEGVLKVFKDGAKGYDQMVHQGNIPVYSMCEHHMLPFFGTAFIAYIPSGQIIGLSKIVRLVNIFARRLQVQERLTSDIAKALRDSLNPRGLGVVLKCRHLCMEMRGVKAIGTETTTSSVHGLMNEGGDARAEFLALSKAC